MRLWPCGGATILKGRRSPEIREYERRRSIQRHLSEAGASPRTWIDFVMSQNGPAQPRQTQVTGQHEHSLGPGASAGTVPRAGTAGDGPTAAGYSRAMDHNPEAKAKGLTC